MAGRLVHDGIRPHCLKSGESGGPKGKTQANGRAGLGSHGHKNEGLVGKYGAPGEIRTPDLLISSQPIPRVYWETGDYCLIWASLSASFVEEELAQENRERR